MLGRLRPSGRSRRATRPTQKEKYGEVCAYPSTKLQRHIVGSTRFQGTGSDPPRFAIIGALPLPARLFGAELSAARHRPVGIFRQRGCLLLARVVFSTIDAMSAQLFTRIYLCTCRKATARW